MKLLLSSILVILISTCSFKPVYEEYVTPKPLEVLDSLGNANDIQLVDTTYWNKSYYLNQDNGGKISSYSILYPLKQEHQAVITLTNEQPDSLYCIYFRVE